MILGVIDKWTEEEADAVWCCLRNPHEWFHLTVGDNGDLVRATVLAQSVVRQSLVQICLYFDGTALQEYQSADRGCLDFARTILFSATWHVLDGFVYEIPATVFLQEIFDRTYFLIMNEEIGP